MKRYIIHREYPRINPDEVQIILVEGSDRLLQVMSPSASRHALEYLKASWWMCTCNGACSPIEDNVLTFSDGTKIYSEMVIWTAGVTGVTFEFKGASPEMGPGHRFVVDEFNRAQGIDDLFIIGDISYHADDAYPHGCPQLAQVAIQQARTLAKISMTGNSRLRSDTRTKGRWPPWDAIAP